MPAAALGKSTAEAAQSLAATCAALATEVEAHFGYVSEPARSGRRLARSARLLAAEEASR